MDTAPTYTSKYVSPIKLIPIIIIYTLIHTKAIIKYNTDSIGLFTTETATIIIEIASSIIHRSL
jgi:hypothetical protein